MLLLLLDQCLYFLSFFFIFLDQSAAVTYSRVATVMTLSVPTAKPLGKGMFRVFASRPRIMTAKITPLVIK